MILTLHQNPDNPKNPKAFSKSFYLDYRTQLFSIVSEMIPSIKASIEATTYCKITQMRRQSISSLVKLFDIPNSPEKWTQISIRWVFKIKFHWNWKFDSFHQAINGWRWTFGERVDPKWCFLGTSFGSLIVRLFPNVRIIFNQTEVQAFLPVATTFNFSIKISTLNFIIVRERSNKTNLLKI